MAKTLHLAVFAAFGALTLAALGCNSGTTGNGATSDSASSTNGTKSPTPATPAADGAASFADVSAILARSCIGCHGATRPREGLSLVSYESLMKGGEQGTVVVAGDPAASKLVKALKGEGMDRMPFKQEALPAEDISKIEAWISAGAKAD
jgi:mono/diheme cytochrome c family protein